MSVKKLIADAFRRFHAAWLRCRAARKPQFAPSGRVAIVAPHPDDEVIGCGGLIARLVAEGRMPHIVVMTGGGGSHRGCCATPEAEIIAARRGLTRNALAILGVTSDHIHELDYPDGGISAAADHSLLEALLAEIAADVVMVPHWGEGWPDHVATARIVSEIAPQQTKIYEYCVWMWYYNVWRHLDWPNAFRLKMSSREHQLKLRAMDAYVKPLAPCGRPWSGVLPDVFIKAHSGDTELYFCKQDCKQDFND